MWRELSINQRNEYKRLILAFAGLTEAFAQKLDESSIPAPVINSKFQETVFQKAFNASAEDIGNTSYDVSLIIHNDDGIDTKYLVGIKTFGINSGYQKVAQFKANLNEWSRLTAQAEKNAKDENGEYKKKEEIDRCNHDIYMNLAKKIASLRNRRIDSSIANLRGFQVDASDDHIFSVYHVLMPSPKNVAPKIYVGETSYDKIDISNISIAGCTRKTHPANFVFGDGRHYYRYTSADSQLLMDFTNHDIVVEQWDVLYADDVYKIISQIADDVLGKEITTKKEADTTEIDIIPKKQIITEEYIWPIANDSGEVELFSGFNSFFGVGSKLGKKTREKRIEKIAEDYKDSINKHALWAVVEGLKQFLLVPAKSNEEKIQKVELRRRIITIVEGCNDEGFRSDVIKLLFRSSDEMYIPIPDSKLFHEKHPDFFAKGAGKLQAGTNALELPKEKRKFNLVFEPSGNVLPAFITQDNGKAIESYEKQSHLGKWIRLGVFQLEKYQPLTRKRLDEIGINALRLYKVEDSDDVHIEFIWMETEEQEGNYTYKYPLEQDYLMVAEQQNDYANE